MTQPSTPSTPAPGGEHGPAQPEPTLSRYPVPRPPHPLAITSVVTGALGVIGLPLLATMHTAGWWIVFPTLASLVAVVSGHVAIRRIARSDRSDRRLAASGLFAGYLGLTILVAETVLLVGLLSLAATVFGRAGG